MPDISEAEQFIARLETAIATKAGGNVKRAAEQAGVPVSSLHSLRARGGFPRPVNRKKLEKWMAAPTAHRVSPASESNTAEADAAQQSPPAQPFADAASGMDRVNSAAPPAVETTPQEETVAMPSPVATALVTLVTAVATECTKDEVNELLGMVSRWYGGLGERKARGRLLPGGTHTDTGT